jgi:mannose-6-phosphate isomerase-like protein (cupin superfamily)
MAMLIKRVSSLPAFIANDGCLIREVLHPSHGDCRLDYSLALAEVAVGEATYRHWLEQSEVYFILEGEGDLHIGTETARVVAGDAAVIPPQLEQWIENVGQCTLRFLAICSPPWRANADHRLD